MGFGFGLHRGRVAGAAGVCLAGLVYGARRFRRVGVARYARDVMSWPVQTISGRASVARAAERFAQAGVGVLPVCDEGGRLVGVLSDRDLVVRVLAQGEDPAHTTVLDCADSHPITASENESLASLRARMQEGGVRRIPIVRHGRVVGIVGASDLLNSTAKPSRLLRGLTKITDDHRSARWLFDRGYRPGTAGLARIDERRRRADDAALAQHIHELRRPR